MTFQTRFPDFTQATVGRGAALLVLSIALSLLLPLGGKARQGQGENGGDSWIIITAGSRSIIMNGDVRDERRAEILRSTIDGNFIYFTRNGRPYVITDQALVESARHKFDPQEALSRRQSELSEKQAVLSEKQAELSREESQVRVNVPDFSEDLCRIRERMRGAKTQEELSDLQAELSALQAKLSEVQARAGEEQARVGDKQAALGNQQAELGNQQAKLGDEQARIAEKASREIDRMLDRALKDGTARPAP